MVKVDRLCNRVEPFAALFSAFGIVLATTWPCLPARNHFMSFYGHWSQLVNFSVKTRWPPPICLSRYAIYLWLYHIFRATKILNSVASPVSVATISPVSTTAPVATTYSTSKYCSIANNLSTWHHIYISKKYSTSQIALSFPTATHTFEDAFSGQKNECNPNIFTESHRISLSTTWWTELKRI